MMQKQESFDRFYAEFVTGGALQCVDKKGGSCVYRNEEGKGCAIGIQPEFAAIYVGEMESNGINALYHACEAVRAIIRREDLDFFSDLQELHDGELLYGGARFASAIREFATQYNMQIPVEVQA